MPQKDIGEKFVMRIRHKQPSSNTKENRNISLDKECSESKVKVWAGEELQDEKLLVKINETLELESEKSKKEFLKDEILSLFSIVEDVKDIISKKEHNIRLNDLKKELTKKHPKETVDYLLNLLEKEESTLMKEVVSLSIPRFEIQF